MEKLVLVGTNTLAAQTVDFIERYKLYEIIGFTVNEKYIKEPTFMGKPVFPVEHLEDYIDKDTVKLFCTVSWYNHLNRVRKKMFDELKEKGFTFANLISPHALVYTDDIGEGNWIHDFAHIGHGVKIGNNNVFRMKCVIGHNCVIGNHNFFGVDSVTGGYGYYGDCCFTGLKALVFNRIAVGNRCVIGAGSILKSDLPDFSLCVAPKSFIKQCDEEKIESYITPAHMNRSVEEFNEMIKNKEQKGE